MLFLPVNELGIVLTYVPYRCLAKRLPCRHWSLCRVSFQLVMETVAKCPNPLFVSLLMKDVVTWSSDLLVADSRLTASTDVTFSHLLTLIESRLGLVFVSHTLSYITVAAGGLSEASIYSIAAPAELCAHFFINKL